ncbi:hypothetical protein CEXT_130161 [Caerostris extrusa]|uniref:Uncharacterized protein n=1 Tax=Caerostris extrusa TaxID=172846 RepID=A0AAV4VZQ0_CAEEX|nr:hypothetical protein CEXT_130161 [Caerostris extrusa]
MRWLDWWLGHVGVYRWRNFYQIRQAGENWSGRDNLDCHDDLPTRSLCRIPEKWRKKTVNDSVSDDPDGSVLTSHGLLVFSEIQRLKKLAIRSKVFGAELNFQILRVSRAQWIEFGEEVKGISVGLLVYCGGRINALSFAGV